ncbi:flagellar hook assembly protein FlgD [Phenylobacterium sp.]|uniref:flagellar hook assembly protein FlgD n=1 Tax=Phenylobacterium sp. TaxID=1871053 RepID=UPI0025F45553|nr:flagellar hook assembly protein FlgD [Phenylobacterium sp.]MBX3486201.1 flagellar hook assembly protein FlgD [Phenylobacterium sp.]MCW5760440.1 flagellar hook assembly protein FlgD [Phenylobacterium sp.]
MVDAVSGAAATTDSGALGRARLAENFDTFLSLLTTQLKNQDPLSPLDSNQFTQQIVQMTGVEQQLLTNDLLKKLVSNTGSGVSTAVALIGKEVRADADVAALKGGKAEWTYILDRDASDVKLEVLDEKGRVVRSIAPTDNKIGEHKFTWDGKSAAGASMADGTYTLRVTAKDSQGSTVASNVVTDGVVTGVQQRDGATLITVNGAQVSWDKIVSIRQPPEPVATASNGASDGSGSNANPDNKDDETSPSAAA